MNTITIKATNAHTPDVSYNEVEVQRFINDSRALKDREALLVDKLYNLRRQLRDFFKDQDWDSGEITINKKDVNELLGELECDRLTSKYVGTFTITGTFNVEADDEEDVEAIISDSTEVDNYLASINVEQIETFDIEEDE
jgi:hypothetical protein